MKCSNMVVTPDDTLSRIGISLPRNMLEQFDTILDCRGYKSRSEGIRDAIRTYNLNYEWLSDNASERKGVITRVFYCTEGDLLPAIIENRYAYHDIIRTSLQRNISRDRYLEVLLVQGTGANLRELAEHLMSQKGVESVKLTMIPLEE